VPDLARRLATDERGMRILCNALAGLGILLKDEDHSYRNAAVAEEVILPDSPLSKRTLYLHSARQMARWQGLFDCVRLGRPTPEEAVDPRLTSDPKAFAAAMDELARAKAGTLAEALDLSGVVSMLDVGGGPGTYAIELARRHTDLRGVVLERSETAAVAEEQIAAAGLEERLTARSGDAFYDDLGGPYDLVLVSNLIHIYSSADNRALVARCAGALAPGGRLAVKDLLLDPGGTTPVSAALFAVNMLVSTEAGDCYTVGQVAEWLLEAGLTPEPVIDLDGRSRVLVGRRH